MNITLCRTVVVLKQRLHRDLTLLNLIKKRTKTPRQWVVCIIFFRNQFFSSITGKIANLGKLKNKLHYRVTVPILGQVFNSRPLF
jgi:hypothetical protein